MNLDELQEMSEACTAESIVELSVSCAVSVDLHCRLLPREQRTSEWHCVFVCARRAARRGAVQCDAATRVWEESLP